MFIVGILKKTIKTEFKNIVRLLLLMPVIIWEDRNQKRFVTDLTHLYRREKKDAYSKILPLLLYQVIDPFGKFILKVKIDQIQRIQLLVKDFGRFSQIHLVDLIYQSSLDINKNYKTRLGNKFVYYKITQNRRLNEFIILCFILLQFILMPLLPKIYTTA